jgi:DNA-directed RNA polymerase specialized sigma24 family protein
MKRNAGAQDLIAVQEAGGAAAPQQFDVIALDDAIEGLQQMEPRLARAIELHYFGGLTHEQIAATVGASVATVQRDIRLARAWLLNEIGGTWPA